MPGTTILPLLRSEISLDSALEQEENILLSLFYPDKRFDFYLWLYSHRLEIERTVAYHLGLSQTASCRVGEVKGWIYGSFNVCIFVYVNEWIKRVLIRFPLPYKIGGSENAEEKLRCEAATYIWLQEHCPNVPISSLWRFSFYDGQAVSD